MGLSHDSPFPPGRPPPFVVRVAVYVMFLSLVWLVAACVVAGAAFVVSMLGGDVVTWLLGVPFGLAITGAVVGVLGVVLTGWERGGG